MFFRNTLFVFFFENGLLKRGVWEVRKKKIIKKEGTNLRKKRKPKNTNLDQSSSQKSSKENYLYSAKMTPKKVDKLITFEVAKRITLVQHAYKYIYIERERE